jgi:curved DNA-binding protein CbpA
VQDYYAILGLDPSASGESIKTAYRRLARENHPDHTTALTEAERNSRARVMTELNEAYAVLSDAEQRREYNERLRLMGTLAGTRTVSTTVSATVSATATHQTVTGTKTSSARRVRPRQENDQTLVSQVSDFLWNKVLTASTEFSWKETVFEGFERGAEASSWASCYCVALRGFSTLDAATIKKFLNYSSFAVAHHKRAIRTTHFAFLLAFEHAYEWESVANQCQSFGAGKALDANAPSNVLLLDMRRGQVRRFGAAFHSKSFEQLIQSIRISA